LEDPEDYKAFELSVTADFDAQTAVERELVLRLASLLWRLRRGTPTVHRETSPRYPALLTAFNWRVYCVMLVVVQWRQRSTI
jgi:hypothetical protein